MAELVNLIACNAGRVLLFVFSRARGPNEQIADISSRIPRALFERSSDTDELLGLFFPLMMVSQTAE